MCCAANRKNRIKRESRRSCPKHGKSRPTPAQDWWKPVMRHNRNRWTLVRTVMALAMVTASVFGELYEAPQQMYSRHPDRQSRDFVGSTPGYTLGWIGKTITHVGWFPRNPDTGRE